MPAAKDSHVQAASGDRPTEEAFRELIRAFGVLDRVMQPYFAQFGISGAQWGVLRNLHRAEQEGLLGLRLTDLGERLFIRPPSVTGVVDRLQRAGLVARQDSLTDLRAKRVALTDKGRKLVEQVLLVHHDQINTVMDGLSQPEQAELYRLLHRLREHLAALLAGGQGQNGAGAVRRVKKKAKQATEGFLRG